MRMLAAMRHSAQCRALRAAKAREAMLHATEEDAAREDNDEDNDDDAAKPPRSCAPSQRRH
jgi:hypothetical protein